MLIGRGGRVELVERRGIVGQKLLLARGCGVEGRWVGVGREEVLVRVSWSVKVLLLLLRDVGDVDERHGWVAMMRMRGALGV